MKSDLIKSTLLSAAREAGRVHCKNFLRLKSVREKSHGDVVTNSDLEAEKRIKEIIGKNFPRHAILAEESGFSGNSDYTWIVDPLDGTNNFSRGIPFFNTSIALAHGSKVVAGVVYNPILKETFFAERGKGAFLNDKPIHVSQTKSVKNSFLFLCDGHSSESRHKGLRLFNEFKTRSLDLRKLGAAALELAYVACGRADGFVTVGANAWDWSAGNLLIEEAGGKVTGADGFSWSTRSSDIVASNSLIHREFLVHIKHAVGKKGWFW